MQTEVIKQQLDTYPPIRSVENSMKYQMPEPAEIQSFGNSKPLGYTYADMCEAFDAGRAAGLEAAAERVECEDIQVPYYLADAIRNLKETPCA